MDQKSEATAKLISALDACRHDSDDCGLPEVASVLAGAPAERVADYRRAIETIDRAVAGAMQEVPVPGGLAERILAGVYAHSSTAHLSTAADQESACDQELFPRPAVVAGEVGESPARRPSRRLVVAGAGLALAASLLVGLFLQLTRERLDAGDLLARAKVLYESEDHRAPFSEDPPPVVPPVGSYAGWRPVPLLSRADAAFELSRGRATGTLYVVPLGSFWGPVFSGDLPTTPIPQSTSGMTVAVWRDDKNAYVMIVKGDRAAFYSLLAQKFA